MQALTPKQRQFCLALVNQEGWNFTEAARQAGYSNPGTTGHKQMQKPHVLAYLERLKKKRDLDVGLDSKLIWAYFHRVLFFNPKVMFRETSDGWWWIMSIDEIPDEAWEMVTQVQLSAMKLGDDLIQGIKVRFVDKTAIAIAAMRHAVPLPKQEHEVVEKKVVEFRPPAESVDDYNDPISRMIEEGLEGGGGNAVSG